MEQYLVRKDIRNCQTIEYHPDYYLFNGDTFRAGCKLKGIDFIFAQVKPPVYAIAILSGGKILVEDRRCCWHILDLVNGQVLASKKMPQSVMYTVRFAVSNDERTAYRIWLKKSTYYLAVIDLSDLSYCTYVYPASLHSTCDLVCTDDNKLLVLETQVTARGVCHSQITLVMLDGEKLSVKMIHQWESEHVAEFFDGRYILDSAYDILDIKTGESFNLLENSDIKLPEKYVAMTHVYYPEYNYLQLVDNKQNIFIDCGQRKIIAWYYRKIDEDKLCPVGYKGLCVGDGFWIGRRDGIYAMPFPVIESV